MQFHFTTKGDSLRAAVSMTLGRNASHVSLLYFFHYIHVAGGVKPLLEVKGGAQQTRLASSARLCRDLQAKAESDGARVLTGQPVVKVAHCGDGTVSVTTQTSDGEQGSTPQEHHQYMARNVIIAAPLCLIHDRTVFEPPLSPARIQLATRTTMVRSLTCYAKLSYKQMLTHISLASCRAATRSLCWSTTSLSGSRRATPAKRSTLH